MAHDLASRTEGGPPAAGDAGKRPDRAGPVPPLRHDIRSPSRIGMAVLLLFFVVGGAWAAAAPLGSAVIASGRVGPEIGRRTVQHLEGGILETIAVHDGQRVQAGQTLVVLEDVAARAQVGALRSRLRALAAAEARLEAERTDASAIAFDHPALADRDDPAVAHLLAAEREQLRTLRADRANRTAILRQRIAQLDEQIAGHRRQREGVLRQLALIEDEIAAVQGLVEKGLAPKPRLLALQREQAELQGRQGELEAQIALARETKGETELEILNLRLDRLKEVETRLAEVRMQRTETEERLAESRDRLKRTVVTAPVDGTILNLRFTTTGGVVRPGDPILDLVPAQESLVIEARIRPTDVDSVQPGLPATVTFPSIPMRHQLRVQGEVRRVSADVLEDERTGEPYFAAQVAVDRKALQEKVPDLDLQPGLPAEVSIATGERTVLDYLVAPLEQSFSRAMRED